MSRRVTIKQVAKQAGVSHQTVSRVINNKGEVAPATRDRVLAAIHTLKYQSRATARMLTGQKASLIAMIASCASDILFSDPHLLKVVSGISSEVAVRNCGLMLLSPPAADPSSTECRQLLREHLVDGIIVDGQLAESGTQMLVEAGYPVVVVGYNQGGIPCVHPDDEGGAYGLAQHLLALSHRRIGVIGGQGHPARQPRLQGFKRAFRDVGLNPDSSLLVQREFPPSDGYNPMAHLMQRPDPPTAICTFTSQTALGALGWLRENGFQIPNDLSVASFDDITNAEFFDVPLTTVCFFAVDLARRATALLFDLIEGASPVMAETVLPSRLVARCSTAVAPRSRRGISNISIGGEANNSYDRPGTGFEG